MPYYICIYTLVAVRHFVIIINVTIKGNNTMIDTNYSSYNNTQITMVPVLIKSTTA